MEKTGAGNLELSGGPAGARWRLPYGSSINFTGHVDATSAPEGHAYFTHGPWLRLIDIAAGRVVGRWRFPGAILGITPAGPGGRIEVQFRVSPAADKAIYRALFDPSAPVVPAWDSGSLLNYRASETEATALTRRQTVTTRVAEVTLTADQARAVLPDLEEAWRRDGLSPWLGIVLGKVLRDAGDARASEVFKTAVRSGAADFTELFRIAAFLEHVNEPDTAATAYDRAYSNYLERRNDPRLMILLSRLILYSPFSSSHELPEARRRQIIERVYQLSPTGEFSEYAWRGYAKEAERAGQADDARLWAERARVAESESLFIATRDFIRGQDRLLLVALSAALAVVCLVGCLYVKYLPQRRLEAAAQSRRQLLRRIGVFNLDYWSRGERVSLLIIVAVGWYAIGLAVPYVRALTTEFSIPVTPGSLANPQYPLFFTRLPDSPERDLLLAISHHQTGDAHEAERRYRALPQFAESWNNLGVILSERGSPTEARAAYERALQLDPDLQEARINTGAAATGLLGTMYQRYRPGQAVIALPGRETFLYAYVRGAWTKRYWRALLGPLPQFVDTRMAAAIKATPSWLVAPALVFTAALAVVVLLMLPSREVTQPPGPSFRWIEMLLPGVSPVWKRAAPFALMAWIGLLLVAALTLWLGEPYLILNRTRPSGLRVFGLADTAYADAMDQGPILIVVVGLAVVLSATNLFLIRRAGRGQA